MTAPRHHPAPTDAGSELASELAHDLPVPQTAFAPTGAARVPVEQAETREDRARLAARVLVDAVLIGALGDALLRAGAPGANLGIWGAAVIAALLTLARRRHDALPPDARWLLIPAVALTLAFAWRDSPPLTFYNAVALTGTLALLAASLSRTPAPSLIDSRISDLVRTALSTAVSTLFGAFPLVFADVSFRDAARGRGAGAAIAGLRAALIAIPLLLVFGSLLASADPMFGRMLGSWFSVDVGEVSSHLFITGVLAWLIAGFLRGAVVAPRPAGPSLAIPSGAIGALEISTALGSLVVLFLAFVAVQFRYFFGGAALIDATTGLTFADYARRGFFELVAVSALVLPLLLCTGALRRQGEQRTDRAYRLLSGTLLALLAVIMYSALARMRLYQDAYGLTTDRFYATVFMGWLALVFAWFAMTVLRDRPRRFAAGALVSALGVLAGLNVLNPAAFIARRNIARADRGQAVDILYLRTLGADAVPLLVNYLARDEAGAPATRDATAGSSEGRDHRCDVARDVLRSWGANADADWRSWTMARTRARHAVQANDAVLRTVGRVHGPADLQTVCASRPAAPAG